MIDRRPFGLGSPAVLTLLALLSAGSFASIAPAQVVSAYPDGPYLYVPAGQPRASVGPSIAAGWERLGDGIVGNGPLGRATPAPSRLESSLPERRRTNRLAEGESSNLDIRFVAHGWVVVWDRLVPLTDLSRDGSLYTLHPLGNGRVRITLDGRELFRDALFASKYEQARTLLEGR